MRTHRRRRCALGLLTLPVDSSADALPRRGGIDPRIRTAMYNAEEVYRLSGFVGYHVDLEFERDESFVGISARRSRSAHVQCARQSSHSATESGQLAQMNLTVTTTKRRYYFDYSVYSRTAESVSAMK